MNIASELLKVAQLLMATGDTKKVEGGPKALHDLKIIMQHGDIASFKYVKKDGSKRDVLIRPTSVFGNKIKGVDLDDPNHVEKMFFIENILTEGGEKIEGPAAPVHTPAVHHTPVAPVEPEAPKEVKLPIHGFKVLTDLDLVKSLHGLVKYNNGLWKSDKQRGFLLSKINRGKHEIDDKNGANYRIDYVIDHYKHSDDLGVVTSDWEEGEKGFKVAWVFFVDKEGVRSRYRCWKKVVTVKEVSWSDDQAQEDLADDYGGRPPQYLVNEIADGAKEIVDYVGQTRSGEKKSWERSGVAHAS